MTETANEPIVSVRDSDLVVPNRHGPTRAVFSFGTDPGDAAVKAGRRQLSALGIPGLRWQLNALTAIRAAQ